MTSLSYPRASTSVILVFVAFSPWSALPSGWDYLHLVPGNKAQPADDRLTRPAGASWPSWGGQTEGILLFKAVKLNLHHATHSIQDSSDELHLREVPTWVRGKWGQKMIRLFCPSLTRGLSIYLLCVFVSDVTGRWVLRPLGAHSVALSGVDGVQILMQHSTMCDWCSLWEMLIQSVWISQPMWYQTRTR